MTSWLLLAASLACAAPSPRRALPELWASVQPPAGWTVSPSGRWTPPDDGSVAASLSFREEVDASAWIKDEAHPSEATRRIQRLAAVRAGQIEQRGPWKMVEIEATTTDGKTSRSLVAAMAAPGGAYVATFTGPDPAWSKRKGEAAELIESLRRMPPPIAYSRAVLKGKFSVDAPEGEWKRVIGDPMGDLIALAPASPDRGRTASLEVSALGGDEARTFLARRCPGGATRTMRARGVVWSVAEASVKPKDSGPATPEVPASVQTQRRLTRCGLATIQGRAYGVEWESTPAAYEYGLPAFERALATLKPEP